MKTKIFFKIDKTLGLKEDELGNFIDSYIIIEMNIPSNVDEKIKEEYIRLAKEIVLDNLFEELEGLRDETLVSLINEEEYIKLNNCNVRYEVIIYFPDQNMKMQPSLFKEFEDETEAFEYYDKYLEKSKKNNFKVKIIKKF